MTGHYSLSGLTKCPRCPRDFYGTWPDGQLCAFCEDERDEAAIAAASAHLGLCAISAAVTMVMLAKVADGVRRQFGPIATVEYVPPPYDCVSTDYVTYGAMSQPDGGQLCGDCSAALHDGDEHHGECIYAAACHALGVPR